jgi:hypothetical protein
MEVTCWHCHAVFDPDATGKRCPHCGRRSEAWLAKLRFAAIDFLGPLVLMGLGLSELRDAPGLFVLFVVGSLLWAGFIYFQDTGDWIETPATDLNLIESRPAPESLLCPVRENSNPRQRPIRTTLHLRDCPCAGHRA